MSNKVVWRRLFFRLYMIGLAERWHKNILRDKSQSSCSVYRLDYFNVEHIERSKTTIQKFVQQFEFTVLER